MEIPVTLLGNAPGVVSGGSLRFPKRKLKVKALLSNLPDTINADISKLEIGDKLFVRELNVENCAILHPENTVVAQVRMSRAAVTPTETEEGEGEEATEEATEAEA
jgi:large subunit ribosomal protein L25